MSVAVDPQAVAAALLAKGMIASSHEGELEVLNVLGLITDRSDGSAAATPRSASAASAQPKLPPPKAATFPLVPSSCTSQDDAKLMWHRFVAAAGVERSLGFSTQFFTDAPERMGGCRRYAKPEASGVFAVFEYGVPQEDIDVVQVRLVKHLWRVMKHPGSDRKALVGVATNFRDIVVVRASRFSVHCDLSFAVLCRDSATARSVRDINEELDMAWCATRDEVRRAVGRLRDLSEDWRFTADLVDDVHAQLSDVTQSKMWAKHASKAPLYQKTVELFESVTAQLTTTAGGSVLQTGANGLRTIAREVDEVADELRVVAELTRGFSLADLIAHSTGHMSQIWDLVKTDLAPLLLEPANAIFMHQRGTISHFKQLRDTTCHCSLCERRAVHLATLRSATERTVKLVDRLAAAMYEAMAALPEVRGVRDAMKALPTVKPKLSLYTKMQLLGQAAESRDDSVAYFAGEGATWLWFLLSATEAQIYRVAK